MKKERIAIFSGIIALCFANAGARTERMSSPDGKIVVEVSDDNGNIRYSIGRENKVLIEPSEFMMDIDGMRRAQKLAKAKKSTGNVEHIVAPFYRQKEFDSRYNSMTLTFDNGLKTEWRVFDDGVAYRFVSTDKKDREIIVDSEDLTIDFAGDPTVYLPYSTNPEKPMAMAFQNIYTTSPLSRAKQGLAFLPVTADMGGGVKVTVLESDLESYPGMFVSPDSASTSLKGVFAKYPSKTDFYPWRKQEYVTATGDYIAKTTGNRSFPWRIFAITDDDREMPTNNLVYALASPSRVRDISWIKPGKVAWDWWNDWGLKGVPFKAGINTETYKYYIDFASENGIEYIVLDEGWYDPKSGDMLTVIPDIDLPGLIAYGKEKGVGIVLWTVFNVLDSQLEEACKKYSDMGIAGFKVDFLDRDDQTAVEMTYRLADECAKNHLFLDYHGIYKPVGLNRTYPNVLNYEGVFGMEEVKWTDPANDMPLYDVTFPYIRLMAGQVDYTPGAMRNASKADWKAIYYNPMSMGTRAHQLSSYIIHDSPFTMLCDAPTNYTGEEECVDFIAGLPVVFDSTSILDGKMGEYIVTARRKDASWFIGAATNWDPREITLDFSFLPEGKDYKAEIFSDGPNADKQAQDYARQIVTVNSGTKMPIRLASGGGFAMRIDPLPPMHGPVTAVPAEKRAFIDDFYKKYIESDGFYIVTSDKVSDEALGLACDIVGYMMLKRPDVKKHMVKRGAHLMIIGKDEQTCDIPEYCHVCTEDSAQIAYINWRARGFGGAPEDELSSSCGEENLLALPGDKYTGENILIHEFAHLISMLGIAGVEPDFPARLEALYNSAKQKGLWDNTYALSDKEEYFAESVQSFFNCNRYANPSNGVHNHVNRRAKLKAYDPDMYKLLTEYFYEIDIPIKNEIHQ